MPSINIYTKKKCSIENGMLSMREFVVCDKDELAEAFFLGDWEIAYCDEGNTTISRYNDKVYLLDMHLVME